MKIAPALMTCALIGAAGALTLAMPAQAQPKSASSCFWTRDLRNHTVGGDDLLYFDVGGRDVYAVKMSNKCLAAVTSSDPIVMRERGGMGQICNKMDLDISARGNHCIAESLTKLTPAEVAALPKGKRP
ncbi:MAG TPA: hypothetical protein VIE16_02725 [Phenylobacterium sp.]|jgi:hypothetical protein